MSFPLPPNSVIGLVGGGQLGRMSAMAAARLGYRCHILTREQGSPAGQVAAGETVSDYSDPVSLQRFAEAVDVISFEFENVSAEGLELLASIKPVRPSPEVLRISQDRVAEKAFLNRNEVATTAWAAVNSLEELTRGVARVGLPAVLKTTRYGYDGKGQVRLRDGDDLVAAFEALAPKPLILEKFVDFACEVSVVAARGVDGVISCFDVTENRHRAGILDVSIAPARVLPEVAEEAQGIARQVAEAFDVVGIVAVEMFLDSDGRVLANEIAPRPHNSGHWTIEACPASQFEMHIRAVAGLALPPAIRHSDAVMKNLVGPEDAALWPRILGTPGFIPHLYGKAEARPGRKMGHVTRLFPKGGMPGEFGVQAALGFLAHP
jgi:5-(carboxyamino)imidazole ribonucleotide synthase